jgi:DNA-binding beta-propeller fold protein YncE
VYNGARCGSGDTSGCGPAAATITAGLNPLDVAVDPDTNTVYAPLLRDGEAPGQVAVIDGSRCNGSDTSRCGQAPTVVPVGFGAVSAAVDPITHRVYVVSDEDASVSVIDGRRCNGSRTADCNRPPSKLPVDDYPMGIVIVPEVGTAYVTSAAKGTVSVVGTSSID